MLGGTGGPRETVIDVSDWDSLVTARCVVRLLFCVMVAFPSVVYAWGPVGHEVVCEIAYQELDRSAQREVGRLIHLDDDYPTFSAACNWPDQPRKRAEDHYVNLSRGQRAITEADCPKAPTCLFTAIEHDLRVLKDSHATDREKLEAIKFLGHWVGDIHQPMHVSYQDDLGANLIEVRASFCEGSLHHAWDECLIEQSLGSDSRAIARRLLGQIGPSDRAAWRFDSPVEWANESYQIATAASTGYCRRIDGACWYADDNMILQRGEDRRVVRIDRDYVEEHEDIVADRLKRAGVRLAALLNEALR